jgi:hypothetical protein
MNMEIINQVNKFPYTDINKSNSEAFCSNIYDSVLQSQDIVNCRIECKLMYRKKKLKEEIVKGKHKYDDDHKYDFDDKNIIIYLNQEQFTELVKKYENSSPVSLILL